MACLFGARTITVKQHRNVAGLAQHRWLLPFLRRAFMEDNIGKRNSALVKNNPCLFAYRRFSNSGSLAILSPSLNSPPACSHHSNLQWRMKIRQRYKEPWMMSDEEVRGLITMHECEDSVQQGIVGKYESNHLPSNNPIEDRRFVTRLLHDRNAFLFGVLDGHGGDSCAHNVSQRLPDYIGTALLPQEILLGSEMTSYFSSKHLLQLNNSHNYYFRQDPVCYENLKAFFLEQSRIQRRHERVAVDPATVTHLLESHAYHAGFIEAKEDQIFHTMKAISKAFLRLDDDLSHEALSRGGDEEIYALRFQSALSGACALVALIKGTELTIANCGDCRAVLGTQSEDGLWTALQLSNDHTAGNPREVQRILNEHPAQEATTCLRNDRLLGRLAPLRAFGDVRFKWSKNKQEEIIKERGLTPLSQTKEFLTPPYLTAEPEVTSYQLQPSHKFLILATDGLWDMMSNQEAVECVRDNIKRHYQGYNITFKEQTPAEDPMQKYPYDLANSASFLIRESLGGEDHVSVSTSLSIPSPDVRMFRDDITIIVVHFDWTNVSVD